MSEAISAMREAFTALSNKMAVVPNRINMPIKDQNALHLSMPAYIQGGKYTVYYTHLTLPTNSEV